MNRDHWNGHIGRRVRSDSAGSPLSWTRGPFFNAATIRWTAAILAVAGGLIYAALDFIHHS